MSDRARGFCLRVGSIFVLVVIWWAAAILMADVEVLPGPVLIATTIWANLLGVGPEGKTPYFHMGITLGRTFAAFAAAIGGSTATVLIGNLDFLADAHNPHTEEAGAAVRVEFTA